GLTKTDEHGIIQHIDLSPVLVAGPAAPIKGILRLEPHADHTLARTSKDPAAQVAPVGPDDTIPATAKTGELFLRPIHFEIQIDPVQGVVAEAPRVVREMVFHPSKDTSTTHGAAFAAQGSSDVIVDWRPDIINSKFTTAKKSEKSPSGSTLSGTGFIHLHQTSSPGANIGSAINAFINPSEERGAHYIVDRNGFIVKMANEEIRVPHCGGKGGASWFDLLSEKHGSHAQTIKELNNLSIGVEHVHDEVTANAMTSFTKEQAEASCHLVGEIAFKFGVSKHKVLADGQTRLNTSGALGTKADCPGTGFHWDMLEDKGLATKTEYEFSPSPGAPLYTRWQTFETFFTPPAPGADTPVIDRTSPKAVKKELQSVLADLGYFVEPTGKMDDATLGAMRVFIHRHFAARAPGTRRTMLGEVRDAMSIPIANKRLLMTMFAVLNKRGSFRY
ncbi:MAG: N-acetylmuramoyl-L-alanine amidase, partial [Polyangiaceae bacterium]